MFDTILKNCSMYLPYPALALTFSLGLTYLAITLLPLWGFVDIPRGRHQHEKTVPRGGGIAIWISFFVTVFLLSVTYRESNPALYNETMEFLRHFFLPAAILFVVGLLDDRYELRSIVKLLAQIAVGVLLFRSGGGISDILGYQLSTPLALAVTVFWCVMIINAFNLIDGVDGVAAGLAASSAFLLAVWILLTSGQPAMTLILLIFCASSLGFLRFNFSPARIFMGDTGSMFIGLFFACISMTCSAKSVTLTSLLVPLAAIGVPMFDVCLAVLRRFCRRYIYKTADSKVMEGDRDHLHHRILNETGTARKTAYVMYCISIGISLLAMASAFFESSFPTLIFVLFLIIFFVMIRYSSIELCDTLTHVVKGVARPHRNFILTALHPFLDTCACFVAFGICEYFFGNFLPDRVKPWWLLMHVAPFVVIFCFSGIYRTFWLRAGIIQYYKLARLLLFAGIVGYILNCILYIYILKYPTAQLGSFSVFYVSYVLWAVVGIAGERFLLRYYESFGYRRLTLRNRGRNSEVERVIVYGGGFLCRMYVYRLYCGRRGGNVNIIGVIDDNPALNRLNVYGFNVLGSLDSLESIYSKTPFDAVVVTCRELSGEKLQALLEFQKKYNVRIVRFSYSLDDLAPCSEE